MTRLDFIEIFFCDSGEYVKRTMVDDGHDEVKTATSEHTPLRCVVTSGHDEVKTATSEHTPPSTASMCGSTYSASGKSSTIALSLMEVSRCGAAAARATTATSAARVIFANIFAC
jgi:hypothetical protein